MARRRIIDNPKILNIVIEGEVYSEIEKLSLKTGMPVSRLSRNLLLMGMEDLSILQKTGLLTIVLKWRDYQEKLQEAREMHAELDGSICLQ